MDLNNFYKRVKDIIIYPGSLDELNEEERILGSGRIFTLNPINSGLRTLQGIIIPDLNNVKENLEIMAQAIKMPFKSNETVNFFKEVYEKMTDLDIRIIAKEKKQTV